MAIRCPNCNFEMELKGARPGRFNPRCQQCGQVFTLVIPADPNILPTATKAPAAPAPADGPAALSGQLGGYKILQPLGTGTVGDIYLGSDLTTDRHVAIKVLAEDLAADPVFAARFTREAFAAAQLSHPHLIRTHEIDIDRNQIFLAMELVDGDDLGEIVRKQGRLHPDTAAAYILQAARGLKFAHERGVLHRDVRPENLMLDRQGMVKIADLGIIKRTDLSDPQATGINPRARRYQNMLANLASATPAFMAPEQAQDAAHADSRADIYSLGCTFYHLLTGRPPFMGGTIIEIVTKHQREPITPPEMIVREIPRALSNILLKMTAKKPAERFQAMGEIIRALEDYLGVTESGPYAPRNEQIAALEAAVRQFDRSGWAVLRTQILVGFYTACGAGAVVMALLGRFLSAGVFVGTAVLATVSYLLIAGATQQTDLFVKARQAVKKASIFDWIVWAVALGAIGLGLVVSNWILPWIGGLLIGVLGALGFYFTFDQLLLRDRRRPLDDAELLLRQLRERGVDETRLRQFVCRTAGERWEQFYEELFGYESKLEARRLYGSSEGSQPARKYGAWRDRIHRWADRRLQARSIERHRNVLRQVETRALIAQGVAADEAKKRAEDITRKLIDAARRLRSGTLPAKSAIALPSIALPNIRSSAVSPGTGSGPAPASIMNIITSITDQTLRDGLEEAPEDEEQDKRQRLSWFQRRFGSPVDLLIGKQIRFLLAVMLLVGFGLWWRQNKASQALAAAAQVAGAQREIQVAENLRDITRSSVEVVIRSGEQATQRSGTRELEIPHVPRLVRLALSSWNAGLAGLILLLSVACYGRLMSLTVLLAAAVALVGHWFEIPNVGAPLPWMSAAAGGAIAFVGLIFLRRPEGI